MSNSTEASTPSKGEFWVKRWQEGQTKWDLGQPTPALCDFLDSWKSQRDSSVAEGATGDGEAAKGKDANRMLNFDNKELETHLNDRGLAAFPMAQDASKDSPAYALVPGCGSGYDVCLLASYGWQTTGLDISPIAVSRAKLLASSTEEADLVDFKQADFFEYEPPSDGFHLIFDYTFFCAINPDQREAWAKQMANLVRKDGYLLTLMFPLRKYGDSTPPNVSTVDDYHKVLDPYFDKVYQNDNPVSTASRQGYEAIGLWKRKAS